MTFPPKFLRHSQTRNILAKSLLGAHLPLSTAVDIIIEWPLRVLNTVGVARGLGDHDLLAKYSGVKCKEFLTPQPEVNT